MVLAEGTGARGGALPAAPDVVPHAIVLAPQVAAELSARLGGDDEAVRSTARLLDASQRLGRRPLPDPLPAASSSDENSAPVIDHELALLIVLADDPRAELIALASGRDVESILHAIGHAISVGDGRRLSVEPACATAVLQRSDPAMVTAAHRRLAAACARTGDAFGAHWHSARGATGRSPELVAPLLAQARLRNRQGRCAEAFRIAAEAFDHAEGADADEARVIAGTAALGAGWFEEAADWLGSIGPDTDASIRRRALAPRFVAEALRTGAVAATTTRTTRPSGDDPRRWREWARAAALAAVTAAERGATTTSRNWLVELRDADLLTDADGALHESVVALCRILAGESIPVADPDGTLIGAVSTSIARAAGEEADAESVELPLIDGDPESARDPLLAGAEASPLARAYLAVVEALLLFWRGDVGAARARLHTAAAELPVALPLAGLGVQLVRRLDILVDGAPSPLAEALTAALPRSIRLDQQQDRAHRAYLAGDTESAALHAALWVDRGAPQPALSIGTLDEVGPEFELTALEPPEASIARELCHRIRAIGRNGRAWDHLPIAESLRGIHSPYLRARVEALLGTAWLVHDDRASARRHLRTADHLFAECGADAWRRVVRERLDALGEEADALAACRANWAEVLTERELAVAMLIVEGHQNKAIAERLGMSVRTIEVHAHRVFGKLGVGSRLELAVLARRAARFA